MKLVFPVCLLLLFTACSKPCTEELQVVSAAISVNHNVTESRISRLDDTLHYVIDLPTTLVNQLNGEVYIWNGKTPMLALELRPYRLLPTSPPFYNFRNENSAHELFQLEILQGDTTTFNKDLLITQRTPSYLFLPTQDQNGFHWEVKLVPELAAGTYGIFWRFFDEDRIIGFDRKVEKRRCEDFIVVHIQNEGTSNIDQIEGAGEDAYQFYLKLIDEQGLTFFTVGP